MSHFTVLVIGKDPEKQLEPFDENLTVPEYDEGPVSQEEIERFVEHYANKSKNGALVVTAERNDVLILYRKYGKEWNSNRWRIHTDGTLHEYSTYNPSSKWDWYQLGGRWSGYFKIKQGVSRDRYKVGVPGVFNNTPCPGFADQCFKADVDFETMVTEAANEAAKIYDAAMVILQDLDVGESWKAVVERLKPIEAARAYYWSQKRQKAWEDANKKDRKNNLFYHSVEDFS